MLNVYLLLGSNIGDRLKNLEAAIVLLNTKAGTVTSQSALYETEAWGNKNQQAFLNQAILIKTNCPIYDLLHITQEIETLVGRTKTEKWGPRVIDIDILFYGDNVLDEEHLKVPHTFIQDRRFTLVPLCDIAANFEHPILKKTMKELLDTCKDVSEVKRLESRG